MKDIDLVKRAKHIIENGGMLARDTSLALIEQLEAVRNEGQKLAKLAGQNAARAEKAEAALACLNASAGEPIYQERRFHVKGKSEIEYWADVNSSTYGYVHESQRRILYAAPAAVPEKVVKLPEWFYPDGDIDCPPAVNLCDVKNALDAAGVKWVEGE